MKRFQQSLSLVLVSLAFTAVVGCKEKGGDEPLAPIPPSFLKFDSNVPHQQQLLLSQDVNYLKDNDHTPPANIAIMTKGAEKLPEAQRKPLAAEAKRLMGLSAFTGQDLYTWLDERVGYILDESYDLYDRNNYVVLGSHSFENPTFCPGCFSRRSTFAGGFDGGFEGFEEIHSSFVNNAASGPFVVMSNVGGSFYLTGKMNRRLFGARIPGQGVVPVSSYRTGILQVGEGLFRHQGSDPQSVLNKILRLGTLFHEARHSDGNKDHIGFGHAVCPRGFGGLTGEDACEDNLNGSYTIGAVAQQVISEKCYDSGQCSRGDINVLRSDYLDSYRRVLDGTTVELDPTPEGKR